MKKLITFLLVLLIGVTFAGCETTTNSLAYNIENNVSKLTQLIEKTKEVSNDDIILKEFTNNYASTVNQTKKVENTVNNLNNVDNAVNNSNNVDNEDNNSNNADNNSSNIISNEYIKNVKTIKNMPKQEADTQIVKDDKTMAVSAKTTINNTKNKLNKNQIKKVSQQTVNNIVTPANKINIKRLTTGSYTPRRIELTNYDNSGLSNYLSKIEDIYLMMNDACQANNDCNNLKSCILENCDMLNMLCKQLKNKEINLNNEQTQACNDCLAQLNKYCNNLNNTKNDVQTQCNAVKKMNINPNANTEQISSKYVKLINCLDDRITCYSNILSILVQLKCSITGICGEENVENIPILDESNLELKDITLNENPIEPNNENTPNDNKTTKNTPVIEDNKNKATENTNKATNNIQNTTENTKITEINSKNIEKNNVKKINDFGNKNLNVANSPKHNLDTFKNETIKPNIINKKNNKIEEKNVDNNSINNTNNDNNQVVNQPALPNNVNTINNGINANGLAPIAPNGVGVNGINGINAPNGIVGGGNIISNGYGYHNYENGITNPYRNTDTYKLPIGNGINGAYNGIANGVTTGLNNQPLEKEARKNFKPFAKIS